MEPKHRFHPVILRRAREMRHPQTLAEATLWHAVRNRRTGFKFRRQQPIERFIADLYCAEARLLIEIDGASHFEPDQEEYDKTRTEYLEQLGYQVIRFTNNDVRYNLDAVVDEILRTIETRMVERKESNPISPHPSPLPRGERGKD